MNTRLDYATVIPEGYRALAQSSIYLGHCGLEAELLDLVYLRVSQINGCAYCVDLHSHDALQKGVSQQRVQCVVVWQESPFYTERERAAFAWAETVTLVAETHIPDAAYEEARGQFDEKELADLTLAIATMNAWNRMAISFRKLPAVRSVAVTAEEL